MPRIFSGIQPSGELHIGNYLGAVKNWVALQHQYESLLCIVNYHAITVPTDAETLRDRTHAMAVSLLAAGIDPDTCTLFVQSQVPEHTELNWIFNTVTPLGELERQTQFKEKAQRQESIMVGLLNYPVLQAADILLYRADLVPVGEDQVQHLELSREIARRWNARYAPEAPFFPEPQPALTPTRRVMGLDGQSKMSKSMGNTVDLLDALRDRRAEGAGQRPRGPECNSQVQGQLECPARPVDARAHAAVLSLRNVARFSGSPG
jgi:tryptophanyl-tRNA synthetase